MKNWVFIFLVFFLIWACSSTTNSSSPASDLSKKVTKAKDTVRIANDSLEYEVIIIDPGFNSWLVSMAQPRNFYSLIYLENKNQIYVNEWNNRVMQPYRYNSNLYGMMIDYDPNIRYGYEVNYLIYNYMIYFQNAFRQKLAGYVPMR